MPYEVYESACNNGCWYVEPLETLGQHGSRTVCFCGPEAEKLAREYADWKNDLAVPDRAAWGGDTHAVVVKDMIQNLGCGTTVSTHLQKLRPGDGERRDIRKIEEVIVQIDNPEKWSMSALEPLTVEQARGQKVCRICRGRADGPLTLNYGAEFAHTACLPSEEEEVVRYHMHRTAKPVEKPKPEEMIPCYVPPKPNPFYTK